MRTWTLTGYECHEGDWNVWVQPEPGDLAHHESVEVIELEPVLRLLKRATADTTLPWVGRRMIRRFIEEPRR